MVESIDKAFDWDKIAYFDNYVERRMEWIAAAASGLGFLISYVRGIDFLLAGPLLLPPFLTFCYFYFYKDLGTYKSTITNLLRRKRIYLMLNSVSVVWSLTFLFLPVYLSLHLIGYVLFIIVIVVTYTINYFSRQGFVNALISRGVIADNKILDEILIERWIMRIVLDGFPILTFFAAFAPYFLYSFSTSTTSYEKSQALTFTLVFGFILFLMFCLLFMARNFSGPKKMSFFTTARIVKIRRSRFSPLSKSVYSKASLLLPLLWLYFVWDLHVLSNWVIAIFVLLPFLVWIEITEEFDRELEKRRNSLEQMKSCSHELLAIWPLSDDAFDCHGQRNFRT